MFISPGGIVFERLAIDFYGVVDPLFIVLSQEAITAHQITFYKPITLHCELHIARRGRAKVAAGPIHGRNYSLMESDNRVGDASAKAYLSFRWPLSWHFEIAVAPPRFAKWLASQKEEGENCE